MAEEKNNKFPPPCQCCLKLEPLIECLTETDEKRDYKYYENRRSYLDTINTDQQASLDSKTLALSGTFLAFSTSFIDKIVPLSDATHLWVLFCSWGTLLVSALSTLLSFKFSALVASEQIPKLDEFYGHENNHNKIYDSIPTKYDTPLEITNSLGFWLFFVGVFFLISFVVINVDQIGTAKIVNQKQQVSFLNQPEQRTHDPK